MSALLPLDPIFSSRYWMKQSTHSMQRVASQAGIRLKPEESKAQWAQHLSALPTPGTPGVQVRHGLRGRGAVTLVDYMLPKPIHVRFWNGEKHTYTLAQFDAKFQGSDGAEADAVTDPSSAQRREAMAAQPPRQGDELDSASLSSVSSSVSGASNPTRKLALDTRQKRDDPAGSRPKRTTSAVPPSGAVPKRKASAVPQSGMCVCPACTLRAR